MLIPATSIAPPLAPEASTVPLLLTISPLSASDPPWPCSLRALTEAPLATSTTRPEIATRPAPSRPEAETRPATRTVPPSPPPNTTEPLRPEIELAETLPDTLIASRTAACAVAALISTRPP